MINHVNPLPKKCARITKTVVTNIKKVIKHTRKTINLSFNHATSCKFAFAIPN